MHTELPKSVLKALKQLTKRNKVDELNHMIQVVFEEICVDEEALVEIPEGESINFQDWYKGVKDLTHLSEEQLWGQLGLEEKILPFFQKWTDLNGLIQPWSNIGDIWLADERKPQEPLKP